MGLVAGGGPLAFLVTGVVGIHVWRVGDQAQQVGWKADQHIVGKAYIE
jgi:hypothetical protein